MLNVKRVCKCARMCVCGGKDGGGREGVRSGEGGGGSGKWEGEWTEGIFRFLPPMFEMFRRLYAVSNTDK